jgi:cold shock CspA family protein
MGRSQESFNKRENEKKRTKKKQDKQQKKEDRKANSEKGKSLDDMIAYVDAFGNITSTPPDPISKSTIKAEDIQIGVARQAPIDPADLIRKGKVTFFNNSKGYGFIRDDENQESVFVHINGLEEAVQEGDKVTFETEQGPKGLNAIKVKRV